jgi:chemotaxis protein histidine kinase CheA
MILDEKITNELFLLCEKAGQPEMIHTLVLQFVELAKEWQDSALEQSPEELARSLHTLRGRSGSMGATYLMGCVEQAEIAVSAATISPEGLQSLHQAIDLTIEAWIDLLKSRTAT